MRRPDGAFSWRIARTIPLFSDLVAHDLRLTSQIWRDIEWHHRLVVLVPHALRDPSLALVLLTGGNNLYLRRLVRIARLTGITCAILYNVPRQPLFGGLREDALLSYTFQRFIETGERDWPLLFPMVKSAVRAMDALQAFASGRLGIRLDGFAITGGSKRGWTTWLTAAVDARVRGIVPAVYDNLDISRQMRHQLEVWGEFSDRIHDYTEKGLPQMAALGVADNLLPAVDPAAHLERITVPKLIVMGTNDRYWPLDALNLYLDRLRGETRLLYIPNTGHGALRTVRAGDALAAFLLSLSEGRPLPRPEVAVSEGHGRITLRLSADRPVSGMSMWTTSASRRDFRNALWRERHLSVKDGVAEADLQPEPGSYTACFLEARFRAGRVRFRLTTPVHIVDPSGAIVSSPATG